MIKVTIASLLLVLPLATSAASAKGCIKGALAGGVAGHYAGHHAIAGAMAGCAAGHYIAKRHDQRFATHTTSTMTTPAPATAVHN